MNPERDTLDTHRNSLLISLKRAPYSGHLSRAALETALAAAVFEIPVGILFLGEGVLHLAPGQDSTALGEKNRARIIDSMPLYDLDRLYAESEALARHGLDEEDIPTSVQILDTAAIRALISNHDHILDY